MSLVDVIESNNLLTILSFITELRASHHNLKVVVNLHKLSKIDILHCISWNHVLQEKK